MNNYKNYTYNITSEQWKLINEINDFRDQKGLLNLGIDNKIPNYIIDRPVELIFNSEKNFFKFSKTKFLFKFYKGNFEENFKKRNENIINTISKDNLNEINIISQGEFEYIFIYENLSDIFDYSFDETIYLKALYGIKDDQKPNSDYHIYNKNYNKYIE